MRWEVLSHFTLNSNRADQEEGPDEQLISRDTEYDSCGNKKGLITGDKTGIETVMSTKMDLLPLLIRVKGRIYIYLTLPDYLCLKLSLVNFI